jgi:hypothetical protein
MQTSAVAFLRCAILCSDPSALGYMPCLCVCGAILANGHFGRFGETEALNCGAGTRQTWRAGASLWPAQAEEGTTFRDGRHSLSSENTQALFSDFIEMHLPLSSVSRQDMYAR